MMNTSQSIPRDAIDAWLAPRPLLGQRRHFRAGGATVYLRVGVHIVGGQARMTLDLANVEVDPEIRGRGLFSAWLTALEHLSAQWALVLTVENVVNPIVEQALQRRGYAPFDWQSYYKPDPSKLQ